MKNRRIAFTTTLLALACFGLSPRAQAVLPPPDGGYPNDNTAEGTDALFSLDTSPTGGYENTAIGFNALFSLTTGGSNTAIGLKALFSNTTGDANTANGVSALHDNTTGFSNTANGYGALASNTSGTRNTANGAQTLIINTTGSRNTATGFDALFFNTTGNHNSAYGWTTLLRNTTGNFNIALGDGAGDNLTTGDSNIDIGNEGVAGESSTIRIGTLGTQTATYIAGIMGRTVPMGTPVFVNANGQLGTTPSSARFKDQIKPMDKASEAVLALKPVTFHYKKELDPQGIPQFGLVAEEVEKVNRDLVTRDAKGKVYTVRYEAVNAMLLNEFLKQHKAFLEEHRKVEEQGREAQEQQATIAELKSTVARQQKEMETVVARLKEQDSKIQRVSHQVEMSKFATRRIRRGGPAPRMVVNR
jgi:hypothetical protein